MAQQVEASPLDNLFEELAAAGSEAEALSLEHSIYEVWTNSGSDTADLLLDRATMAVSVDDAELALDLLERLEEVAPKFAAIYYLRAQIGLLGEDYAAAMANLDRTLELEPRHFHAIAEVGHILLETGRKAQALKAYRMALDIHPFLTDVQKRVETLEKEFEGKDI